MESGGAVQAVLAHRRFIAVSAVIAANVGLVLALLLPATFSAQSRVVIGSITDPDPGRLVGYQQLAQTYAQLAGTTPIMTRVAERIGEAVRATSLVRQVAVRVAEDSSILTITASAGSASLAADIANAVADEIVLFATPAAGTTLATIVERAVPPREPSSPSPLIVAALATVFGVGLAALVAIGLERVPASVRRRQALDPIDGPSGGPEAEQTP